MIEVCHSWSQRDGLVSVFGSALVSLADLMVELLASRKKRKDAFIDPTPVPQLLDGLTSVVEIISRLGAWELDDHNSGILVRQGSDLWGCFKASARFDLVETLE